MKRKAFTLLELLVVITIIGILSSIVIVSMSGSTDSATIAKGKAYSQQIHALLGANAAGIWNFDEGEGTTAYDISGYGNDGSIEGNPQWIDSGIEGMALSFDGDGDNVNLGNILQLGTSDWTYSLWFKGVDFPLVGNYLLSKTDNGGTPFRMLFGFNNVQKITFVLTSSTNGHYGFEGDDAIYWPVDYNWHYIVIAVDRSSFIYCYLDGILMGKENISSIENQSFFLNRPFRIGSYNNLTDESVSFFNGFIDEVHIYSEALPATEIQKHYVQGLKKLLSSQAITKAEYERRTGEFNQFLASVIF
jgi:prepilin-type N-terminal cleavage/methylation domain-containing protein